MVSRPPDPDLYQRMLDQVDNHRLPVAVVMPAGVYVRSYAVHDDAMVADAQSSESERQLAITTVIVVTKDEADALR